MSEAWPDGFVRVSADGTHFVLDDAPYFFAGCNCYYLMTRGAEAGLRHEVLEVLDAMQAYGLTVLRTWAFCDGPEWNALQPEAGVFDERVFAALDWVLAEAAKRGLKVMLSLTNYWAAYGGMPQYVRWSCERRGRKPDGTADKFYADINCQDIYHNFLVTVVSRVNTISGLAYRDDPTIMAWELANEPRCDGDYSGSILQEWIDSTSEFMKSIDPNHLLTIGSEGFLGSSTPELLADNPFNALNLGCDFLRNHATPCIDFATIHLWPDTWLPGKSDDDMLRFARRWINCHVDCCSSSLGKPLVIAEFGKKPEGVSRAAFYDKVYRAVLGHALLEHAVAGSTLWMTAARSYPDYDGFTVYLLPAVACMAETSAAVEGNDVRTRQLILQHAKDMAALNAPLGAVARLVSQRVLEYASAHRFMAGCCCSSVAAASYPDADCFCVRLKPHEPGYLTDAPILQAAPVPDSAAGPSTPDTAADEKPQSLQGDNLGVILPCSNDAHLLQEPPDLGATTLMLIKRHAADMLALNRNEGRDCCVM